nr:PREDICTED: protocadherin gamma-C5 isoform X10 [Latimeria chalumnae]|eukprot:XP_014343526.1 PREDICTED: protocadherin gamma-C5 isoform X10 [Latimeria chalumnae]
MQNLVLGQIWYSVPEEMKPGSFVGDITKDLNLNIADTSTRKLQIVSDADAAVQYLKLNLESGYLEIKESIDREQLCGLNSNCILNLQVVISNPLKSYRVEVEILDINDNAPIFSSDIHLEITELMSSGTRFLLESAKDLDIGTNSIDTYQLSPNEHFVLGTKRRKDGFIYPELVLDKSLDREDQAVHHLLLTAIDGGFPPKSGTTEIIVTVLDVNDNAPVFYQTAYKVNLLENSPHGTLLLKLNATDVDEGINGEIEYSFSSHTPQTFRNLFSVNENSGDIRVLGDIDYEEANVYEIDFIAKDLGSPTMHAHCNVIVEIIDVNDNAPEVILTSFSPTIQEDAPPGTVVGLITVKDKDSGKNGEVYLQIPPEIPFKLNSSFSNHYSMVTDAILDREEVSAYTVLITATDSGSPSLFSKKRLVVKVADVNDNPPHFAQHSYEVFVKENNAPGTLLYSVSAFDPDLGKNSKLTYSISEKLTEGLPVSSYVYINSENGSIYALCSFDYEQTKLIQIQVQVKDAGSPSLHNNATVYVFVLDQNDNTPRIIYPASKAGFPVQQTISSSVPAGYFLTKVTAVDSDSGWNAWLSYKLLQATDLTLFNITLYTGEIRTSRLVREQDASTQSLVILVKDAGEPAQSTSVTLVISVENNVQESLSEFAALTSKQENFSDLTLYLIISLASIAFVSIVTFVLLAVKCLKNSDIGHTNSIFACCVNERHRHEARGLSNGNLQVHIDSNGSIRYAEVVRSETQCYRTCISPGSDRSEFMFIKQLRQSKNPDFSNVNGTLATGRKYNSECDEIPPNTDWRFSQGQRPGTSGSQPPTDEIAAWPSNQMDSERLQNMMAAAAAANEPSDGGSTMGAGTLGLSTRYGPQFTLQHVPDYRQNVYIPGSMSSLSNAGQQGGKKKKSGKKDKK